MTWIAGGTWDAYLLEPYLEGRPVAQAIAADTSQGWVEVYLTRADGTVEQDCFDRPRTTRLFGRVRLRRAAEFRGVADPIRRRPRRHDDHDQALSGSRRDRVGGGDELLSGLRPGAIGFRGRSGRGAGCADPRTRGASYIPPGRSLCEIAV